MILPKHDSNGTVEHAIFHKLLDLIPDLMTASGSGKSQVPGYMDLNLDVLHRSPEKLRIALSHYCKHPSGDMIADPDMEIAVFLKQEIAEALTLEDSFSYQSIESAPKLADSKRRNELNKFLSYWLTNLIQQGHRVVLRGEV